MKSDMEMKSGNENCLTGYKKKTNMKGNMQVTDTNKKKEDASHRQK